MWAVLRLQRPIHSPSAFHQKTKRQSARSTRNSSGREDTGLTLSTRNNLYWAGCQHASKVRGTRMAMSILSTTLRRLAAPAIWYNTQLNKRPLLVKSITSGFMYGAGDACAQVAENYAENKKPGAEKKALRLNWRRIGVFFVFGTVIGGCVRRIRSAAFALHRRVTLEQAGISLLVRLS